MMIRLDYDALYENEDKLWFVPHDGWISYMDIDSLKYHVVQLCKENRKNEWILNNMVLYKDLLFWVDSKGQYLREFNIRNDDINYYKLPSIKYHDWSSISLVTIFNNKIIIIAKYSLVAIEYDLDTKQVNVENLELENMLSNEDGISKAYEKNGVFYFFLGAVNSIVVFDYMTKKKIIISYPDHITDVSSAYFYNNYLYFLCDYGIYGLDCINHQIHLCYEWNDITRKGYITITNNRVFIFPYTNETIFIIDRRTSAINEYKSYPLDFEYIKKENLYAKFTSSNEGENYIWLNNRCANYSFRINKKTEEIETYKPICPVGEDYCACGFRNQDEECQIEMEDYGLPIFIKKLCEESK